MYIETADGCRPNANISLRFRAFVSTFTEADVAPSTRLIQCAECAFQVNSIKASPKTPISSSIVIIVITIAVSA